MLRTRFNLARTVGLTGAFALLASFPTGCDDATTPGNPTAVDPEVAGEADSIDEGDSADSSEGWEEDISEENAILVEPTFVLTLPTGAGLGFYIDDDDGVGVLESGRNDTSFEPVTVHPELAEVSPAVLFWAVTTAGTQIPEALLANHEGLARDGQWLSFEQEIEGYPQGWYLDEPIYRVHANCVNSTFSGQFCNTSNGAYDWFRCWYNRSGHTAWWTNEATRYKAGFCLDQGTAESFLYYRTVTGETQNSCTYEGSKGVLVYYLWDSTYSANTYRKWVWWRPSNFWAESRDFILEARGIAAARYDLGVRARQVHNCIAPWS